MNLSEIESWTSTRLGQGQTSPWLSANIAKPSSALSRKSSSVSATSAKKMFGDLPPSSSVTGMMLSEAYCMIMRPVVVSPVKATLAIRLFWASGLPASMPKPLTTLTTPGQDIGDQFHHDENAERRLLLRVPTPAVAR